MFGVGVGVGVGGCGIGRYEWVGGGRLGFEEDLCHVGMVVKLVVVIIVVVTGGVDERGLVGGRGLGDERGGLLLFLARLLRGVGYFLIHNFFLELEGE